LAATEENPTTALNILTLLEKPHDLHALRQLESGAELVDIQALLGHVNLATTQIYTYVSEDRMAGVVAKLL
jgi:integrase/recombinase XerD